VPLPSSPSAGLLARLVSRLRWLVAAAFAPAMRSRAGRAVMAPVFPRLQRAVFRLTRGRVNVTDILVPSLMLETTGARTGQRRETPLMCVPQPDGSFLVAGSNWAQPRHPAWTANLLAHPEAEARYRGRAVRVRARLLDGAERERAWPQFEALMPGYRQYEAKAGRSLRIFRLEPY
jgi:deazaflavin-dependent oxidoreductase (nitroreductase family)